MLSRVVKRPTSLLCSLNIDNIQVEGHVSIEGALMSKTLLPVSSDQRSVASGCNSIMRSAERDL